MAPKRKQTRASKPQLHQPRRQQPPLIRKPTPRGLASMVLMLQMEELHQLIEILKCREQYLSSTPPSVDAEAETAPANDELAEAITALERRRQQYEARDAALIGLGLDPDSGVPMVPIHEVPAMSPDDPRWSS